MPAALWKAGGRRTHIRDLRDELNPRVNRVHGIVQRFFWGALALVLLAALAGAFGGGPLSRATSTATETGITVRLEYPRWSRSRSPETLHLTITAPESDADSVSLILSPSLTDRLQIERAVPEPGSASTGPDGAVYTWSVDNWSGPVRLRLDYRSLESFLHREDVVVVVGGVEQRLTLTQWIFP